MEKTVGIVMPVKNAKKFLSKSLGGIFSQTYKKWKLYCVDDKSDDGSEDVLWEWYLKSGGKMQILISRFNGPAAARNLAIEDMTNIDYVAYCDSDDVWDSTHLENSIALLENSGADMVYSSVTDASNAGMISDENGKRMYPYGMPANPAEFDRNMLLENNYIFISSVVHKYDVSENFDSKCVPLEDWDAWIRISEKSSVVCNHKVSMTYIVKDNPYYDVKQNEAAKKVVQLKNGVEDFVGNIPGWLTTSEGNLLATLARDKYCLEIGSFKGKSACYIAGAARSLTCVDTFSADEGGQNQLGKRTTLDEFKRNTSRFSNINVVVGKSSDVCDRFDNAQFDMIFVDGMHDRESCLQDIHNYWPKLKDNGYMCFHDYENPDWPGVKEAVGKVFGLLSPAITDFIAVVRKDGNISLKDSWDGTLIHDGLGRIKKITDEKDLEPKKSLTERYRKKRVLIAPFSHKMHNGKPNPKNYPWWKEAIGLMREQGWETVQIGVTGEEDIGATERLENLSFVDLKKLLNECDTFVSVDSFFPHFASYHYRNGFVIFSQSDPLVFGYSENVNILKSRKYLRSGQYLMWDDAEYNEDAFVPAFGLINSMRIELTNNVSKVWK